MTDVRWKMAKPQCFPICHFHIRPSFFSGLLIRAEPAARLETRSWKLSASDSDRRTGVKAFSYVNPANEKEAVTALSPQLGKVMPIGGGQDLLARMKDYIS